ncbi:MAG: hypothetical protein AAB776_03950 [Patescibacteria group bacterium]
MALLYFGTKNPEVAVGSTIEVDVLVDTQGEFVNVVSGNVTLPDNISLASTLDAQSNISLWVERPHATPEGVNFSGVIPGGYNGNQLYLFSLILTIGDGQNAIIDFENGQIFLHDGLGTEIRLGVAPLELTVSKEAEVPVFTLPEDHNPPEAFTPVIARDQSLYHNQWFISFTTQDKISGLDYFEVQEGSGLFAGDWQLATSPYLLERQNNHHLVQVRAVDLAGNTRVEQIVPPASVSRYIEYGILLMIPIVLVLTVILVRLPAIRKLWGKHRQRG